MADKRAVGHAYNIDFLNVVFAASSLFVLFSTLWMIWDDYDREWKNYQRQFWALEQEVTSADLALAERDVDRARVAALEAQRAEAEQRLAVNAAQVAELDDQLADVNRQLFVATRNFNFTKATYDVDRYDFESRRDEAGGHGEGEGEVHVEGEEDVTALYERWVEEGLIVERLTAERDALRDRIGEFNAEVDAVNEELGALTGEADRLRGLVADMAPNLIDDYLLNAPLLDFMAPTLTVRQTITPNVVDDVNFIRVPKMDRCQTCHLAIDRAGYEDYPQPFRTHPNLETYVGSSSPHPLETTGCTVCHEGMGQSISFVDAAHSPSSPEQLAAWEEEYHWEESHLWDYPMLPSGMAEASCAKCHREEVFIPEADNLNLAYGMYERAGCNACHTTVGFTDQRKPGPNLTKIASKLDEEWVARWIRDPRAVKASTWMPRVWYNSNTSSAEDAVRNEVEIDAVVAYLFANSEDHEPAIGFPGRGNAANGQRIFESVGCLGCHIAGDETREEAGPRRTFGQPLQAIGDKTSYVWLFDWIRNPRHYSPETYMPDLRLNDFEVADVATYLMGLTGEGGVEAGAAYGPEDIDATLLDYMRAIVPYEEAQAAIADMSPEEAAARPRPARDRALRLLQLPRDRRFRGRPAHRHRALAGGQQAAAAVRLRVHPRGGGPPHQAGLDQPEAARPPHLRPRTHPAAPREAAHAQLRLLRGGGAAADHRGAELPARRAAEGGPGAALGAQGRHHRRAQPRAAPELHRLPRDRGRWGRLS